MHTSPMSWSEISKGAMMVLMASSKLEFNTGRGWDLNRSISAYPCCSGLNICLYAFPILKSCGKVEIFTPQLIRDFNITLFMPKQLPQCFPITAFSSMFYWMGTIFSYVASLKHLSCILITTHTRTSTLGCNLFLWCTVFTLRSFAPFCFCIQCHLFLQKVVLLDVNSKDKNSPKAIQLFLKTTILFQWSTKCSC